LDKETVDFVPNYDETTEEPTVLPAPFPNLLVNGSAGIAVGMATNVPPHNLCEVIDGCVWLIENTHFTESPTPVPRSEKLRNLIRLIPAPDFPTAGQIVGRQGAVQAYTTGRGSIMMLLEMIESFVDFRREVVRRRTEFELRKAEARYHILEGLKIALDHLDEVIKLIRGSKTVPEARDGLMTQFGLSQIQSQAILDMQLQRLTGLERQTIRDVLAALLKT